MKTIALILLPLCGMLANCEGAHPLPSERIGSDISAGALPSWPKGIVELARQPSRVYSTRSDGNHNFYFESTPEEINELLALFSKARMRDDEIRIEPGTNAIKSFKGDSYQYNVWLRLPEIRVR